MANVPMLELKDKDGNLFYPVTKVEAVLDDNGNNIDDYIDDKVAGKTGHQILDDEGTAVAQKSKLQFENATVENVGDKTVVTPLSGVTTEPFQTAQGTTAVPMVNSFNGRQGAVSPTNGDYTADMVGAIPVQSGTQGQVLGFVSDNVIGAVDPASGGVTSFNSRTGDITPLSGDYSVEQISATGTRGQVIGLTADNTIGVMNAPTPTYTGTAGQVLGFTATDTVGAINPPQPTYTGSQGQVLGFTDVNTVGAKNPSALFTGTTGQVLGFTGTNTVGALDSGAQYIEAYSSVYSPMFPPYPGETTANGTCHTYGYTTVDRTGLWKIVVTNNARFTKDGLVKFQFALGKNVNTDSEVIYERTFFVPGNMSLVDSFNTDVKDVLLLPLKAGTTLWFDGFAVPQSGGISEYTGSSYVAYYMIEF